MTAPLQHERALLTAANEAEQTYYLKRVLWLTVAAVGLAFGSSYYNTWTARQIATQKLDAYRLCLENQKLAMASAIDRRGYLSIPSCQL